MDVQLFLLIVKIKDCSLKIDKVMSKKYLFLKIVSLSRSEKHYRYFQEEYWKLLHIVSELEASLVSVEIHLQYFQDLKMMKYLMFPKEWTQKMQKVKEAIKYLLLKVDGFLENSSNHSTKKLFWLTIVELIIIISIITYFSSSLILFY